MPKRVLGYELFWTYFSMKLTFKSALKVQLLIKNKRLLLFGLFDYWLKLLVI